MTAKRFFSARIRQALCIAALSTGLSISNAVADTIKIKDDAPQNHTVVKGDTLWGISGKYLEKPWRWPELWEGNPQIANPHLIYPGDVISLYYQDGKPRLGINRARGTVKLSPRARATPINDAIPVVPIEVIQQFLLKLSVLDKAVTDDAPYVIRGQQGHFISIAGERFYAKSTPGKSGDSYQIYRLIRPVKDPMSSDTIGHVSLFIGEAELVHTGDPATLLITSSSREIAVGDRLIARKSDDILSSFQPKVPDMRLNGQILDTLDDAVVGHDAMIGRYQGVLINLGASDGLTRGHVLSTFTKEETVIDSVIPGQRNTVTLPGERSGTLMVIEAFENLSYALAMESRLEIRTLDAVRTPE